MLTQENHDNLLVVKVGLNRIDVNQAAEFRDQFSEIVQQTQKLILLDITDVAFIDSSGLAAIVYCFKITVIKDQLAICGVSARVKKLFEITRMDTLVRLFDDRETAYCALRNTEPDENANV